LVASYDARLILHANLPQGADTASGDGHRDGVVGVALAAMADRQDPHSGGQLGRHVQDLFTVTDQPLGKASPDAVGAPSTAQQRCGQRPAHRRSCW
jgi:hypothetical protein